MLRSTFAFSTFAQFFAVGTNHVDWAACASCLPGVPETRLRREVLFGRLPDFTIPFSPAVLANGATQAPARGLFRLAARDPRAEPPPNAGVGVPAAGLGSR